MNNNKEMVKVKIFEDEDLDELPRNPKDFLKFWEEKFNDIPTEFESTAYINTNVEVKWGECGYFEVEIGYVREETDEEYEVRISKANAQVKRHEDAERNEWERLSKKYAE